MVGVILAVVIPRFAELYEGLNAALPLPTQILISVAATLPKQPDTSSSVAGWRAALVSCLGTLVGGRYWMDSVKLQLPVLGNVWTMFAIAQLSRTLATLLEGGIPLVPALEVAQEASGNRVIADAISLGTVRVREGMSLSEAFKGTGKFPDLAVEMIGVGEQTGALPDMLNHVADFYDEDLDMRLTALLSWVEPVILIFVAVFVALILISLYLPIFSIGVRGVTGEAQRKILILEGRVVNGKLSGSELITGTNGKSGVADQERARQVAKRYRYEFVDLRDLHLDLNLLRSMPVDLMFRYKFVPLELIGEALVVAMADPTDLVAVDEVAALLNRQLVG